MQTYADYLSECLPPLREGAVPVAHNPFASTTYRSYHQPMAKVKKFELEDPIPVLDDEDAETLAAIDEGIRDAEAGRTVPGEEVRKRLPQWISASSTRKEC